MRPPSAEALHQNIALRKHVRPVFASPLDSYPTSQLPACALVAFARFSMPFDRYINYLLQRLASIYCVDLAGHLLATESGERENELE